jgi:hypothetical protein
MFANNFTPSDIASNLDKSAQNAALEARKIRLVQKWI